MLKAGQIDIKVLFKGGGKPNMLMKGIGKSKDEERSCQKKPVVHPHEPSMATNSIDVEHMFQVSTYMLSLHVRFYHMLLVGSFIIHPSFIYILLFSSRPHQSTATLALN